MKIGCLSDLHGNFVDVEKCDLFILAGDLCPFGDVNIQLAWLNGVFRQWLLRIRERGIPVVAIAGNHDTIFEEYPELVPSLPWIYLQDNEANERKFKSGMHRLVDWDDFAKLNLRIWGTPWSLPHGRYSFMAEEGYLQTRYDGIPEGIDILISHSPPFGYLDTCPDKAAVGKVYKNAGSKSILDAIIRVNPKLVVCGHIHQSRGIVQKGNTKIINAASWDHMSGEIRKPIYVDFC